MCMVSYYFNSYFSLGPNRSHQNEGMCFALCTVQFGPAKKYLSRTFKSVTRPLR